MFQSFDDAATPYEVALEELSACTYAELLDELESAIDDLDPLQGIGASLKEELLSLESAQRGSTRFNGHIENIRRGLKHFDCTDAADRANAIISILSQERNGKEPIGSWEY